MENLKQEIKFGTDGWRGVISDNFTFKNVRLVAQAISEWIKDDFKSAGAPNLRVALGYDARFLSKEYAEIVSSVLAANNIKVYLSDEMIPTPALSYGVVDIKGVCGVMITASHNPAKFNGIKIKTSQGGGAGKDITDKVEGFLGKTSVQSVDLLDAIERKMIMMHDFKKVYLKFMKSYIDLAKIKKARFKVIQDVMHGSGGRILEEVLKGSQLKVTLMRAEVNPSFGGVKPEPIAEYLPEILSRVKKEKYDLGLVLDGDADRIGAVAPGGEFISPQRILGLIILHLVRNKKRTGGIVKTTCGTTMLDHIAKKLRCKLYETPVGFKYISDLMVKEKIVAGGEEAGGIGVQDYIPERDGTLAGLLLLEMMVYQKKNIKQLLNEMEKEFGRYYYERADLDLRGRTFDAKKIKSLPSLLGKRVVEVKDYDGIKLICEDESWLMLRPSGTEPLVRAYSEAKSLQKAKQLLKIGEDLLKS
ncbi:MAG TPA: phosphoglucomutase/phosphomannomutase family protein [Candidatus Omnitrophota bacterium]|nr:phosphoglucomutase/phosphomannomutase family protein [Candidatus Omnitrophota bacterium]